MGRCPEGQIYCFLSERCVMLDTGSCPVPPTCGPREVLQWNLMTNMEECVPDPGYGTSDWIRCPHGQVVCIETGRCVDLEGNCAPPPQCGTHEELRWNPAGYEECVPRTGQCAADMNEVLCNVAGSMQCVSYYDCTYMEAKLKIEGDYNSLFGAGHLYNTSLQTIKAQLAAQLGVVDGELWDMHAYPGSIYIVFKAPDWTLSILKSWIYNDQPQSLTDQYGQPLYVNWTASHAYMHSPGDPHGCLSKDCTNHGCNPGQDVVWSEGYPKCVSRDGERCGFGEIFCMMSGRCIKESGACKDPECPFNFTLCYIDGKLRCVEDGRCHPVTFVFEINADFHSVVGKDYMYYVPMIDTIRQQLSDRLGVDQDKMWGFTAWEGSIWVMFQADLSIRDAVTGLFQTSSEQFFSDPHGNTLDIVWGSFSVYSAGGPHNASCPIGQVYCAERQTCVSEDSDCTTGVNCPPGQEVRWNPAGYEECVPTDNGPGMYCEPHQTTCMRNGSLECVPHDDCAYVSVNLRLFGDYDSLFDNMNHDVVKNGLKTQIGSVMNTTPELLWEFNIWGGDGIHISFKIQIDKRPSVYDIIYNQRPQFLSDKDGNDLKIDWSQSYEWTRWPSDMHCEHGDCDNDGCDDSRIITWNRGSPECAKKQQSAHCEHDELYCLMSGKCVRQDGYCRDPHCPRNFTICYQDGHLQCVLESDCQTFTYWFTLLHARQEVLVGEDWSLYTQFSQQARSQLARALNVSRDTIWEVHTWAHEGKVAVAFSGAGSIQDQFNTYFSTIQQNFLTDVNGNILNIEWSSYGSGEEDIDGNGGSHQAGPSCQPPMVFCFMSQTCVNPEGNCGGNVWNTCHGTEMMCFPNITELQHCSAECYTDSVQVMFKLDGSYQVVEGDLQTFVTALHASLASLMSVDPSNIQNITVFSGSIGVMFDLLPSPGMEAGLTALTSLVNNGENMAGYSAIPDSQHLTQNGQGPTTSCDQGEVICQGTGGMYCSTNGKCGDVQTHDHYIVKFQVSLAGATFLDMLVVDPGSLPDETSLQNFTMRLQRQINKALEGIGASLMVAVMPGNEDGDVANFYFDILAPVGSLTESDLSSFVQQMSLQTGNGRPLSVLGDLTIAKINDKATKVFIVPRPIVMGVESGFYPRDIVPADMLAGDLPISLDIHCDEGVHVKGTDGVFSGSATIPFASRITLRHGFNTTRRAGCQVADSDSPDEPSKIGFLAVPDTLYRLSKDITVTPTSQQIDVQEDSSCQPLPENLFDMHFRGDDIFGALDDWHVVMLDNDEFWRSRHYVGGIIQNITFKYYLFRSRAKAGLRETVTITEDTKFYENRLKAKFKLPDGTLVETVPGSLILTQPASVQLCVAPDFSGNFTLQVTREDVTLETFHIDVEVLETNDPPVRQATVDDINGIDELSFPKVPAQGSAPDYHVFDAGQVAAALYEDKDTGQSLGLAVLGYLPSTVVGLWEYSRDGSSWQALPSAPVPAGDTVDANLVLLADQDVLRFTADSMYTDMTWSSKQAPKLALLGWDMTNTDSLSGNLQHMITLETCSALNKDRITSFCAPTMQASYSHRVLAVPLTRHGCDDVSNSGLTQGPCGCGLHTGCEDCLGVPHGNASYDLCGRCVESEGEMLAEINCTNTVCLENHHAFCQRLLEAEAELNSICGSGQKINPAYDQASELCSNLCIAEADSPYVDQCGVECGTNACLDCEGTVNGTKVLNLCGQCRLPANVHDGCTSIGNIMPYMTYGWASVNVSVDVAPTLFTNDTPSVSCAFVDINNPDSTSVPSVTQSYYDISSYRVILTTDASGLTGQFAVECTTYVGSVTSQDQNQTLTVYGHPNIVSIQPDQSLITELDTVTVTGSGFVETGVVYCMVPCSELEEACPHYRGVEGSYVDSGTVTCPVWPLKSVRRGKTYSVHVILDYPDNVDLSSVTSSASFSVKMQAPSAVSGQLDKHGCHILVIRFDQPISKATDHMCSHYFDAGTVSAYSLNGNNAACKVTDRKLYVSYTTSIPANSVLTFKSNAIRHAAEHDTVNANFISGSVTVLGDTTGEGVPDVTIDKNVPRTVGCTPVLLKVKIDKRGCWEPVITWTATTATVSTDQDVVDSLGELNSRAQKPMFAVSGNMLVANVTYVFTMTWTAGDHTGSDVIHLEKDIDVDASLKIYVRDVVNVDEKLSMKAEFSTCLTTEFVVDYSWSLSPVVTLPDDKQTRVTSILPGSLLYNTEYNVTCTATYMTDQTVTKVASFGTKSKPIVASMRIGGQMVTSSLSELKTDEDLVMTCENAAGPSTAATDDDEVCTWSCKENLFGEDSFMACIEPTTEGIKPVQRTAREVTVPAGGRISPKYWDLRQLWTLTMRSGDSEGVAIEHTVHFKEVPIELQSPEVRLKAASFVITDTTTSLELAAKCRKATKYSWIWENTESAVLPISAVVKGYQSSDLQYENDLYIPCGLVVSVNSQDLIAGLTYTLTIEAYNQNGNFYLSTRQEVQVQVISIPVAGDLQIYSPDVDIKALTSPVSVSLLGWWDSLDGTDLLCNFFYVDQDDATATKVKINSMPNALDQGLAEFTLPEGTYLLEATCCNSFSKCTSGQSAEMLNVTAISSSELVNVIENNLVSIISQGGADDLLSMLLGIVQTVADANMTGQDTSQTQELLRETSNNAINDVLKSADGDTESTLGALQSTSRIASENPDNIDPDTQSAIQDSSSEVAKSKTGQADTNRRKRSVDSEDSPEGILESEATILLEAFDATISEDTLTSIEATMYRDTIENIMLGMCQAFTGSDPWLAPAQNVYIRVHRMNMAGQGSADMNVSCGSCPQVDYPSKVKYGSYIESSFNSTWLCSAESTCDDVCLASAQINIDTITLTAATETVSPTRKSDLVLLRFINPDTYADVTEIDLTSLTDPIQLEMTLMEDIDVDVYDYKCMIWVNEVWSSSPCTETLPSLDASTDRNTTTCSCTSLGIIGVFQVAKPDPDQTTSTTQTTTSSTTTEAAAPTDPPSKSIKTSTTHLNVEFSFNNDYDAIVTSPTSFMTSIKSQLSTSLGIPLNSIRNMEVSKGSIIVMFELHASSGSNTLGQMAYLLEDAIVTGTIAFTAPSGGSLILQAGSFSFTEKTAAPSDDDSGPKIETALPYIIGGVLGGLVIIGAVIVIVVFLLKKNQRTFPITEPVHPTAPAQPPNAPPAYALAPPPPYIYNPPPASNKWVEEEKQGVDDNQKKNNGRPASSGSGSSYEKKLTNKESDQLLPNQLE